MAGLSFGEQVNAWAKAAEARTVAVFREAAQTVANEVREPVGAGGNMPVVSGNLRRSLTASNVAMPTVKSDTDTFGDGSSEIARVISTSILGETIFLGFQAGYARRVNSGFTGTDSLGRKYNQTGRLFVDLTAQRWPQIVTEANLRIQKRVQTRGSGALRGTAARQGRTAR